MTAPGPRTALCAVIGHPISHSLSPAMHNAALRADGIDAVYLAFDVAEGRFEDAVAGLHAIGCVGVNVTLPFKDAAARIADERAPEVERSGAANTLVFGDRVRAFNTDVGAVTAALLELGASAADATVLVLGAGGAARGACRAAVEQGAARVVISNRTLERAQRAAADLGSVAQAVPWDDRRALAAEAHLIINATSVGMDGSGSPLDHPALDAARAGGCRAVLDLVYGAEATPLVTAARQVGMAAGDGLAVLVHQGAEAYSLMWGRPAPIEVMRQAVQALPGHPPGPMS